MIACQTRGNRSPVGATVCQYWGVPLPGQSPMPRQWSPPPATRSTPAPVVAPARWVEPRPTAYPPVYYQPAPPAPKDPPTGPLLELVPGLFGFPGIGRIWAVTLALASRSCSAIGSSGDSSGSS